MAVSFKDRAYQHIRAKLLRGGFEAGERLSEEALAGEIGISRTPVREALNRLASEGLAQQLPHYGVFVRKFERSDLAELYDLREMLESYAAGWAAQRRTGEQLAEAQEICAAMKQVAHDFRAAGGMNIPAALLDRQVQCDVRFHTLLLAAANCPQTQKVASDLRMLTHVCGRKQFLPDENVMRLLSKTVREHTAITRALRRRDSEAARLWMSRHLRRGKAEGLAAFDRREAARAGSDAPVDALTHYRTAGRPTD